MYVIQGRFYVSFLRYSANDIYHDTYYTESTRLLSFIYNGKIGDNFILFENNYKDHSVLNTLKKNTF